MFVAKPFPYTSIIVDFPYMATVTIIKLFVTISHFSLIIRILFFSLLKITHSFDGKAQHIQREGRRREDDHHRHARFLPFLRAREKRLRS